jgi:hypothetical protein
VKLSPELGLALDAHRLLVLNAFVKHSERNRDDRAVPYREFVSLSIVGPDARYEILHTQSRSRQNERDREKTIVYGPFSTAPDQPGRIDRARFDFPPNDKFVRREHDGHRRVKRKKSSK